MRVVLFTLRDTHEMRVLLFTFMDTHQQRVVVTLGTHISWVLCCLPWGIYLSGGCGVYLGKHNIKMVLCVSWGKIIRSQAVLTLGNTYPMNV